MPKIEGSAALVMQFAKWPEAGRVKTRLIPALGVFGALNAHITLTLAVLDNLYGSGHPVQFWWDRSVETVPSDSQSIVRTIEQRNLVQKVQQGANLGDRMLNALGNALESHPLAMIVGSDCPSVEPGYVHQALAALEEYDVVLGPSDDGGYVLIGARRVVPHMLDDIDWGTEAVLEQTCERLKKLGLSVALLEPRWDVDEPEDWARFQRLAGGT
ncbi:TIGR04282 family arsenosugar biosynthesis glycosyltransferase [Marinobacter sp. 2_MG-2023]|uniref:TIGR04282 family arsenosugar biosynthesis glycosyltransferase n=1 Tax=Marinobacter sp. 2_MG-2023 TaxID=3062679 RepID=UPI0026E2D8A6|nr:TIGR04282 family arsenosugar biosynthesis glycosyltransferase [Marinobacter sp. 2_MG-2023]MDO6443603.1 TIGR04282 family arsenosugar biosynthesis glycosyltransferase [Marinobacter sp. 2_MG-2023]